MEEEIENFQFEKIFKIFSLFNFKEEKVLIFLKIIKFKNLFY